MSTRCYLDYNASAPLRPEVRAAMIDALDLHGNPSSVHFEGRRARGAIEAARAKVARLAGARPEEVIFTSGGTEANVLALGPHGGVAWRCIVSAIEHPSVLSGGRFGRESLTFVPATPEGVIDLAALATEVKKAHLEGGRLLVSVMLANNETGALQPVREAAELTHAVGGLFHTDAVQAAGRVEIDMSELGADMLSLSAHKLGGPKGVGALVVRQGVPLEPLLKGGGQEVRRRAGTENVAAIVGFGVAAEIAASELVTMPRMAHLRDELEQKARSAFPNIRIFACEAKRLPNTSCMAVPGTKAETLVIGLDLAGIAVSAGAACSSGKVERSHVLEAMGVDPELAQGTIRVSLGWNTSAADIDRFLEAWSGLIGRMKESRAAA